MCCVVGLVAYTGAALAQPAPSTSANDGSTAAFEAGRRLLAQHHPAEACAKFASALELEPGNVGVMLNLGLCNEQLDKLATALGWFRRAQARASERKLAESARAAGDKIAALSQRVPTLKLEVSPSPAATAVTLDGAALAPEALSRVEFDAGHHVIEVTAVGAAAVRRDVDAADGVATTVELVVPPAPAAHPAPPSAEPAVAAQRPAHGAPHPVDGASRGRVVLAGAIGGGLVLGSVALGLAGRSAARATDHPDVQHEWQTAVRYGGTSMFVLGGAALGWAIWSYVRAPREPSERAAPERAAAIVAPAIGDRSLGIGVRGAF